MQMHERTLVTLSVMPLPNRRDPKRKPHLRFFLPHAPPQ